MENFPPNPIHVPCGIDPLVETSFFVEQSLLNKFTSSPDAGLALPGGRVLRPEWSSFDPRDPGKVEMRGTTECLGSQQAFEALISPASFIGRCIARVRRREPRAKVNLTIG